MTEEKKNKFVTNMKGNEFVAEAMELPVETFMELLDGLADNFGEEDVIKGANTGSLLFAEIIADKLKTTSNLETISAMCSIIITAATNVVMFADHLVNMVELHKMFEELEGDEPGSTKIPKGEE